MTIEHQRIPVTPAIAEHLKLPEKTVAGVLQFLCAQGLARMNAKGIYEPLPEMIHLDRLSHQLPRHHSSWRLQAVKSLDVDSQIDYEYCARFKRRDANRFEL